MLLLRGTVEHNDKLSLLSLEQTGLFLVLGVSNSFYKVALSRGDILQVTVMIRLLFEDYLEIKLSIEEYLEVRFSFEYSLERGKVALNRLD